MFTARATEKLATRQAALSHIALTTTFVAQQAELLFAEMIRALATKQAAGLIEKLAARHAELLSA